MADIDVTFGTNAGTAAQQIDHAAASTAKAAQAAGVNTKATQQETTALKQATIAAKEKAAAERMNEVATNKAATATRQMNARVGRGAGVLGGGRAFGAASSLLGMGASTGALIGATAAFTGVGIAIGLLTEWIGKWLDQSKENAKRLEDLNKSFDDASHARGELGIGAANQFGGNIRALTSLGGDKRDLANQYSGKFGFADASSAVIKASTMFPDNYAQVLEEANDAAMVTGKSLADMVDLAKGMTVGTFNEFGKAGAAIAGMSLGRRIDRDQFLDMAANNEASPEIGQLNTLSGINGKSDLFAISSILQGTVEAQRKLTEVTTSQAEAAAALTEEYKKQQEVIQKGNAAMESAQKGLQNYGSGGY